MSTSLITYGMDQIPVLNPEYIDLREPIPFFLMLWMAEGIDEIGRYKQYKYSPDDSGKTLIIRLYSKGGERIAHLIGEAIWTDEERFAPYVSRLLIPIDIRQPEKVPEGTNPE